MAMQSIVEEALKYLEQEREYHRTDKSTTGNDFEDLGFSQVKVIGCGGAGNNTINRLYDLGVKSAETIALNTDKMHLDVIKADKKILIGKSLTRGLGAGGFPEIGRRAAELSIGTLQEVLKDADLVFITAGMGGGTGTGAAPVVAEVAKRQGATVIAIVSTPFKVERLRVSKAEEGINELKAIADTVIILDNNKLTENVPDLPIEQAFLVMDQLTSEIINGISDTITAPSLINLDYATIRSLLSNYRGLGTMLVEEGRGYDKVETLTKKILGHPFLDVDYKNASGALIHITGGPDLTLGEAMKVVEMITGEMGSKTDVLWGARINKEYMGKIKVLAIITGINKTSLKPDKNMLSKIIDSLIRHLRLSI